MKEKYYKVAKNISRWKLDNPIENWLGYKADTSKFWKYIYVLYYRIFDYKYYCNGQEYLRIAIERHKSEIERFSCENLDALKLDMIYSLHRFGTCFDEYFIFGFYNKDACQRSTFVTLKLQYGYCEQVNATYVHDLFEDKYKCYQSLKEYYGRDIIYISGTSEYESFVSWNYTHPSYIYKPFNAHSGKGIRIISHISQCNIKDIFIDLCKSGPFVLEDLIIQGKDMAILHEQSINTVRISTFVCDDEVVIIGAALRMGTGASNVDNAGAGGIYAGIDLGEGRVNTIARDNYGHYYEEHPDTGIVFRGYFIPEWDRLLMTVTKVAKEIDGATLIAWDFAYSNNGWVVVEGNDIGEAYLLQAPYQVGIKSKILSLIDKYNS